jgi:hypothetical protein
MTQRFCSRFLPPIKHGVVSAFSNGKERELRR